MQASGTAHIWLDEQGRAWIDDTNIKVIEVVLDQQAYGMSPEDIHRDYPFISLAQVHAALSYYYDHRTKFDEEIANQVREVDALWRAQGTDTPLHRKLRAAGNLP